MGVSSENAADSAVKIIAESSLFACCLRMEINDDKAVAVCRNDLIRSIKRVVRRIEIDLTCKRNNNDLALCGVKLSSSHTGVDRRVVCGTDDVIAVVKKAVNALLTERMVAEGYNINARIVQLLCLLRCYSVFLIDIFAVCNNDIARVLRSQLTQIFFQVCKPGIADNIAYKKYTHKTLILFTYFGVIFSDENFSYIIIY